MCVYIFICIHIHTHICRCPLPLYSPLGSSTMLPVLGYFENVYSAPLASTTRRAP